MNKFYLAPLEGITGYIYRKAVRDFFGQGISKYYTPFLSPNGINPLTRRNLSDVIPEHNENIPLIPQVLANTPEAYLSVERELVAMGYEEININLGCPSGTVTSKGKGSGMLRDADALNRFLDGVFSKTEAKVSLKTRIGFDDAEDFADIMAVYSRYPIYELTIHPRISKEFYKGQVHMDAFKAAMEELRLPLCYNGDVVDTKSLEAVRETIGEIPVMIGRGMIGRPSLIRELSGGETASKDELFAFHERLLRDYMEVMSGDTPTLHKMKEIWAYMEKDFPDNPKEIKAIYKAKHIKDYEAPVRRLFNK